MNSLIFLGLSPFQIKVQGTRTEVFEALCQSYQTIDQHNWEAEKTGPFGRTSEKVLSTWGDGFRLSFMEDTFGSALNNLKPLYPELIAKFEQDGDHQLTLNFQLSLSTFKQGVIVIMFLISLIPVFVIPFGQWLSLLIILTAMGQIFFSRSYATERYRNYVR